MTRKPVQCSQAKRSIALSLIPRDIAIKVVGEEAAVNGTIYCGYRGYIITHPADRRRLMNMVADKQMVDQAWEIDQWVMPGEREGMLKDFEDWGKPIL